MGGRMLQVAVSQVKYAHKERNTRKQIAKEITFSSYGHRTSIFGAGATHCRSRSLDMYYWLRNGRVLMSVQQQTSQQLNASVQLPTDIQELENSVAANPDDMSLTLQLANSLHDRLLYDKAIPYYKAYLVMNPKDANARVDLGICYKELGNYTEAENEMKTAMHYVPNHLNAHYNLGIVYLSEGNLQESNIWFKRTVALDPGSEVGKRAQQLLIQHNSQSPMQ